MYIKLERLLILLILFSTFFFISVIFLCLSFLLFTFSFIHAIESNVTSASHYLGPRLSVSLN